MGLETSKQEELSKEHKEILKLKAELFYQLDSLTNFHFTPRPVNNDIEINSDRKVIEMEEALPSTLAADPELEPLAPEELLDKKKKSLWWMMNLVEKKKTTTSR
eukprot:UN19067